MLDCSACAFPAALEIAFILNKTSEFKTALPTPALPITVMDKL